jgi:hypothetical protein
MQNNLSDDLKHFIDTVDWTWAKTYADTWPHHYIVKERVDEELFLKFVLHIREYGELEFFYNTPLKYFKQDENVYWTMVPKENDPKWYPPEDEDIINRCCANDTYATRLRNGTLPENTQ